MTRFVLALVRNGHTWVLVWEPGRAVEACRVLGRWAADSRLRFTWSDAAVMNRLVWEYEATARRH